MKKIFTLVFAITILSYINAANPVRIYEIYGGGGNSGATLKNDYIVLFNSSNVIVDISGWGLQYASATGNFGSTSSMNASICNIPSGKSIPARGFFLIQLAAGTGGTDNLPTIDADGVFVGVAPDFPIAMGGTSGKVVLFNNQTYFRMSSATNNPTGSNVVDFVAYGTTATTFEGTGPASAPSNTMAIRRINNGQDTDNNANDFASVTPNPLNTLSPPLPIELTSFNANTKNSKTNLTWQTASEKNNAHFDIERSNDGDVFSKIGQVKGNGNSTVTQNYQFTDATPAKGINYYRLRQVDFDGTESVSKTVSVNFDGKQSKVKVYPTLVKDAVNVELSSELKSEISVRDLTGRTLLAQNTEGVSNQTLNLGALSSGLYILSVRSNESLETVKIYKQ
jgi:Lamin Tail Domain/Secretion system C-terminal sorting domain